jgi:hypothetical protein
MYLWSHLLTKERVYEPSVYKKLIMVLPPPSLTPRSTHLPG